MVSENECKHLDILTGVVSTVESAVRCARRGVRAERGVPGVAGIAVGAATDVVEPTPVRVEHDGTLESLAASARRALLDTELRVGLSGERAHLLTVGNRKERERYESESGEHGGQRGAVLSP